MHRVKQASTFLYCHVKKPIKKQISAGHRGDLRQIKIDMYMYKNVNMYTYPRVKNVPLKNS